MESSQIYYGVIAYVCLLFALCVHEAAHALTADWRGDPSPRVMGRVTLNPLSHIDPVGTVLIPLALLFAVPGGFLIGWAKPVPFNPVNLKDIHRDPVLIALAGPFSNLILALVATVGLRIAVMVMGLEGLEHPLGMVLMQLIFINLLLMIFNLIPVPPLDGHFLLHYLLPPSGKRVLESIGSFGIIIAIVVVWYTPFRSVFSQVFTAFTSVALWGL